MFFLSLLAVSAIFGFAAAALLESMIGSSGEGNGKENLKLLQNQMVVKVL